MTELRLTELPLPGLFCLQHKVHEDERGRFARLFCEGSLAAYGQAFHIRQINHSRTAQKGTVRGLHFQRPPMAEVKMVRCLKGAIFDVMVDLRAGSSSFGHWTALELTAENRSMAYIPEGFAHGFQTLSPETELLYFHSQVYSPAHECGLRHDDPRLGIQWPRPVADLSPRDAEHPGLDTLEPIP